MTPHGHSSISDAVETELQVLATERQNIISLLCTKGRRTRGIRKDWRRDFFYDEDSFTITPLNEQDSSKTTLVARLKGVKEELKIGDRELGDLIGVNFSTVARWFRDEMLPSETRLPKVIEVTNLLEQRLDKALRPKTQQKRNATTDATRTIKDKDSMTKRVVHNNVDNAKTTKSKKSSKTSSTKAKSIDPTNPCSSCPALKEKEARFVDGEGSGENGVVHI